MPGGASRESWDVRVRTGRHGPAGDGLATAGDGLASDGLAGDGDTERRLILLRDASGRDRTPQRNVAVEAAAMIAARAAGVPVAELFDHGEGALGRAYLLMERLDGETIPRRLLRDDAYAAARPGLARRLGEVLARIHRIDPDQIPGLPHVDALGQLTELYDGFAEPRPALEIGLRWLREHQPAPVADTLVHGDFRTGNLMIAHRRASRGARLGAHPPRRPAAGPGLAVHQGLAVRLAAPGRRVRHPGRADGGLRERRRYPAGRADPALVGAVRHGALGPALPQPGRTLPVRRRALGRARRARPPGLRAGVGRPARAGPRHAVRASRSASGPRVPARSAP